MNTPPNALVCPRCSAYVDRSFQACPQCGLPFARSNTQTGTSSSTVYALVTVGVVTLIVAIAIIFYAMGSAGKRSSEGRVASRNATANAGAQDSNKEEFGPEFTKFHHQTDGPRKQVKDAYNHLIDIMDDYSHKGNHPASDAELLPMQQQIDRIKSASEADAAIQPNPEFAKLQSLYVDADNALIALAAKAKEIMRQGNSIDDDVFASEAQKDDQLADEINKEFDRVKGT